MADVGSVEDMSAGATKLVARGYGWTHAGRRAPALADIDLVISPGEKVLLCGDSGSGKSTLLAAIAGVLGGDDEGTRVGEILLEDASGHIEPPGRTIPVGLVLQDPDSQVIAARVGDDVALVVRIWRIRALRFGSGCRRRYRWWGPRWTCLFPRSVCPAGRSNAWLGRV